MIDPGLVLDDEARRRLSVRFGDAVAAWCDALPALVDRLSARWGLTLEAPLAGGTSRTFRCRRSDGRSVVLKLVPEPEIAATEAAALRAWSGAPSVVELLDSDLDCGALLLEGLVPGIPLRESGRQVTFAEVASLLWQLHVQEVAGDFPSLAERMDFVFDYTERRRAGSPAARFVAANLVERSRRAALELAADSQKVLLHGDLHAGNVLDAGPQRGLVVIDPRPCIGDPASDVIDWVLWPTGTIGRLEVATMDDRAQELAELIPAVDANRLSAWCRATAVIAAVVLLRDGRPDVSLDDLLALVP